MISSRIALVAGLLSAGLSAGQTVSAVRPPTTMGGTVLIRKSVTFSFESTTSETPNGLSQRIVLCSPRREKYTLDLETHRQGSTFDAAVCPFVADPARLDPSDCVRFSRLPLQPWRPAEAAMAPHGTSQTFSGSSTMSYRGRDFEFFADDAMSPTMSSWMVDEWQDVDGRLVRAYSTFLAASLRVNTGVGDKALLLMSLLPVSELQRFQQDEVVLEKNARLCQEELTASDH